MCYYVSIAGGDLLSDLSARNIKRYRKNKGWTQAELANKAGVSLMSIRRYETKGDKNREPSADIFDKIAEKLDTTSDILRGKVADYEFRDVSDGEVTNLEATKKFFQQKMEKELLSNYNKVNLEGKKKIIEYSGDIAANPKYIDETTDSEE